MAKLLGPNLARSMQHSVVRRSIAVTMAFVVGNLFYYALLIAANRLLGIGSFGRFYTALSMLNVLYIPAVVLTFMLVRHFTTLNTASGFGAVVGELSLILKQHGLVGAALVAVLIVALVLLGSVIGVTAVQILVLVPCIALSLYIFEIARAALQGALDFVSYSVAWIGCRAAQFVLAIGAILWLGTAWAGLAGILVASAVSACLLLVVIYRRAGTTKAATASSFRVGPALPFILEYGLFIIVNNIDVLIAYFLLPKEQLGIYAATSVLPKAIISVTQPVSQVMLPVLTASTELWRGRRTALLKAFVVCAGIAVVGAAVLSFGRSLACHEGMGIRSCNTDLLVWLALAAIPLSLVRVLVVAGLATGNRRHALVPALAIVAFAGLAVAWAHSPLQLGLLYCAFCWLFIVVYGLATSRGLQTSELPAGGP